MGESFYKSVTRHFGRLYRQIQPFYIFVQKQISAPSLWKWSGVISQPPGSCLRQQSYCVMVAKQHGLSLLLRLDTQQQLWPVWLRHSLHPSHQGHFVHEPTGWWPECLEARENLKGPTEDSIVFLSINIFLGWGHSSEHCPAIQITSHSWPLHKAQAHNLSQTASSPIF